MPQELEEGAGWDLLPPGLSRGQTRPAPFPRRGAPRPGRRGRRRGAADSGGGPCAAFRMGEGVHLYRHRGLLGRRHAAAVVGTCVWQQRGPESSGEPEVPGTCAPSQAEKTWPCGRPRQSTLRPHGGTGRP